MTEKKNIRVAQREKDKERGAEYVIMSYVRSLSCAYCFSD